MISVSGKKWVEKKISKNSIEKIKLDLNFSEIISKLIISRNFDYNEIYSIQNPSKIQNEFKNNRDFINASLLLEKRLNQYIYKYSFRIVYSNFLSRLLLYKIH